jgi:hypothetical protein
MTRIDFVKQAVSIVVGLGTSRIVKQMIENNVETETIAQKVTVGSASVAIGFMAADVTSRYTDAQIDKFADWWKRTVSK